jgi:hypothetical protein
MLKIRESGTVNVSNLTFTFTREIDKFEAANCCRLTASFEKLWKVPDALTTMSYRFGLRKLSGGKCLTHSFGPNAPAASYRSADLVQAEKRSRSGWRSTFECKGTIQE